jgi:hypothetical protein
MAIRIQVRRDTASSWTTNNPILQPGEMGVETDTGRIKFGISQTSTWTSLAYSTFTQAQLEELAQDAVGAAVANGTHSHITVTYDDLNNTISLSTNPEVVLSSGLTDTLGDYVTISAFEALKDEPDGIPTLDSNGLVRDSEISTNIARSSSQTFTGNIVLPSTTSIGSVSANEIGTLYGATSSIQGQLDLKAPLANPIFTGTTNVHDLDIDGTITFNGTATTINSSNLSISDPLIYMGTSNPSNAVDLGIVTHFNNGTYQHSGLVRDHSDGKWKLFSGVTDEPTTVINFSQATYDTLKIGGLEITGTATGITKSMVGLDNVDNTTDLLKPISTATQAALNLKASLDSPTFTGTVIIPTETIHSEDLHWEHYGLESDLPSAALKHGMFAHVHGTGSAYYAHSGGWYKLAKQTDVDLKSDNLNSYVTVSTQSRTIVASDLYKIIEFTNASPISVIIPNDPTDSTFPIGSYLEVRQMNAGQITISATSPATVVSPDNQFMSRVQYSGIILEKRASNTWILTGDTTA